VSQAAGLCGPPVVRVVFNVDAAISHVLFKGLDKKALSAAFRKLNAVLQAPGVQLLVCAGGEPVEVEAVAVLEGHLFEVCGVSP